MSRSDFEEQSDARARVMVVASGGGHWIQLMRMRPAWNGCEVVYVTTQQGYRESVMADARARAQLAPEFRVVTDANRWQKLRLVRQMLAVGWIVLTRRPDAVVTTGAAPGYFAVRFGKLVGARTVWVDSIANAEELSLSGREAGRHVDLWLTQWPHLARGGDGPRFEGAVV